MEPRGPERARQLQTVTWCNLMRPGCLEEIEFHPSEADPANKDSRHPPYVIRRVIYSHGPGSEDGLETDPYPISESFYFRARAAVQADMQHVTDDNLRRVVADLPSDLWVIY